MKQRSDPGDDDAGRRALDLHHGAGGADGSASVSPGSLHRTPSLGINPEQLVEQIDLPACPPASGPLRALLVDGDPLSLELHAQILAEAGMEVRILSEPLRTLHELNRFSPDVVLLDMAMPGASGPELAAAMRAQNVYQQLPILFLSAETDVEEQVAAFERGGDDFMVKPVDPARFVTAVVTRARRARQAAEAVDRLRAILYERERVQLALDRHAIVSVADGAGRIIHVNDKFCEVSGYSEDELVGQNHRIVKSDQHPPDFYRTLWRTIASGEIWNGEICNRRKDGSLYWVESTIVPFLDGRAKPYQYVSIRTEITQIKLAEERLRISQNYANIGTWDWNIRTGELFWSQRIGPLFGYPEGKLDTTYENFLNAVHPDDRQALVEAVHACIERGVKYDIEHRCVWPDGTVRWLRECGDVLRDSDGRPSRMLGLVRDITGRRQAEAALERERGLLREAQHIARLGNWEVVETTGELHWSDTVFEIFGREPDSFTPTVERFHQAVHPDDRDLVRAAIAESRRTGRYDVAHRIVRPDGEIRHVHERARVEHDATGRELLRRGVVQDVTPMKAIEAALQALNARKNEQLEAAHCLRDVTKDTLNDELSVPGMLEACIRRVQFGGVMGPGCGLRIQHGEQTVQTPEFRETPYRITAAIPFYEGWGSRIEAHLPEPAGMTPVPDFQARQEELLRDIARQIGQSLIRREDRRALLLAKEEAEAANLAKSDFLSSMSHELRTPLNAILGFAQVLEIDDLTADQLDSVNTIRKSGQHLLQLINEVLNLAKIEAGHLDLSLEDVSISDVFASCGSLIAPLADGRGVAVHFEPGQGAHGVRADHTRLKQVLVNLVGNAVKYNRPGGSVTVSVSPSGPGSVRIAVTDTGNGIPSEKLGQLFTPFSRLGAEHTDVEGTGIGLVISKRLIEAMGGRIGVKSQLGSGSTFWVELPVADSPAHAAAESSSSRQIVALPTGRILYVENNPANLKLVRQALARFPQISLLEAPNGSLGLDLAKAHQPDLILLDINMPGMSGLDMLARLRADPATRSIPAVAISAAAMEKDIERAMAAGFRRYLTKPINIVEFIETVGDLLRNPDRRVTGDRRAPSEEVRRRTDGTPASDADTAR